MADTAQKEILQSVAVKNAAGSVDEPAVIGASFEDIIDTREGKTPYTVAQFFDAVMDFFQTTDMFYYGDEQPKNNHMQIWIDTNSTQNDFNQ